MKISINIKVILICVILPLNVLSQDDYENDSLIVWNIDRKLTWNDFKALKNEQSSSEGHLADSFVSIKYNMTNFTINELSGLSVFACFHKKHSWTSTHDSKGLIHEQLHFDITELFARKIRKEFAVLKKNKDFDYKKYVAVYRCFINKMTLYHDQFDNETINWYVKKRVKENVTEYELVYEEDENSKGMELYSFGLESWQEKIAKELRELEAYRM